MTAQSQQQMISLILAALGVCGFVVAHLNARIAHRQGRREAFDIWRIGGALGSLLLTAIGLTTWWNPRIWYDDYTHTTSQGAVFWIAAVVVLIVLGIARLQDHRGRHPLDRREH
jgi:hypothetical protein